MNTVNNTKVSTRFSELLYSSGVYDHILSFLNDRRGTYNCASTEFLLYACRNNFLGLAKAKRYTDMIIRNRLVKKDITEIDVYRVQDRTGITNEEIIEYLSQYPNDPNIDDLMFILCDLIEPGKMTSIVYSKRSMKLLARTWNTLFSTGNNYLHVFLEYFDIESYRYIVRGSSRLSHENY